MKISQENNGMQQRQSENRPLQPKQVTRADTFAGKARTMRHTASLMLMPLLGALALCLLFATVETHAESRAETYAQDAPVQDALVIVPEATCDDVTTIPSAECEALVQLYQETRGPEWLDNTNWPGSASPSLDPCTWFGVLCQNGHVAGLELEGNRLRGTLPASLGNLPNLRRLFLADNALRGNVPPSFCKLTNTIEQASFDYNLLAAPNRTVFQCLQQMDADWNQTQTTPPRNVEITSIATDTITLSWTPISYTADGGYQVALATEPNGPFTEHGTTTDKTATGYVVDNLEPGKLYFLRVRAFTPAHADQSLAHVSDAVGVVATTQSSAGPVLVLIYLPADNDLSPYAAGVLERVRRGTAINPNIQVSMLIDRRDDHDTRLFEVAGGVITPTNAVVDEWGIDELDTSDPQVLAWFLRYGREQSPDTTRTVVSLMGHGMGMMPEFAWLVADTPGGPLRPQRGVPALPKGIEATPGDITNAGGYMSTYDFGVALAEATDDWANPFDIVFFDQCFQGNLDVLYEVHRAAEIVIASPNYAWLSAPYHQYLAVFTPASLPEQMANQMIRLYEASLSEAHPNTVFWLRGADVPLIGEAASDLALALRAALAGGQGETILRSAQFSQYVDTTQCGRQQMQLGPPDELLGAGSFASNLRTGFEAGDAYGVYAAAGELLQQLEKVEALSISGNPYLAPNEFWSYTDSLTLLAPLRRHAPGSVVWRASIYTTTIPLTAVWTPVPTQTVEISTTFAFAREGEWDDFIAEWYDGDLPPTLGEWCQYIPPALVTGENTEDLMLELQSGDEELTLSWSETTDPDAETYWILAREERFRRDLNWILVAALPLSQTTFAVPAPEAGRTHSYLVVAQDGVGVTVAEANTVSYTAPGVAEDYGLFLPTARTD